MKNKKSGAVSLFLGLLLIVIFGVGLTVEQNPAALVQPKKYDHALQQFGTFCSAIWLPAGIIGIPLFLFSLIKSLIQEHRANKEDQ
ncbi:hypothetical protein [Aristaeella hokkaidonensis]|uniref:Uncharacterized protein n=1 Tax=Aristaeella hokkaidonensis TaxID=3046382 RepID=A0AC61MZ18_9FIRM|nr:hypothetical protein [Aristaeella hokkaidonensis]QUC68377.1 hypothetical protein JYE49_06720 [Aristaeella hokkaidonensis]SNT95069.1 hypothetical protein SAMN06297421_10955 [Aristaeella hokkaidonensis]